MAPFQDQQGMAAALMQPQGQQPPPQSGPTSDDPFGGADAFMMPSFGNQFAGANPANLANAYGVQYPNQMQGNQPSPYPSTNPFSSSGPLAGAQMPLNSNAQMTAPQMPQQPYSTTG